MQQLLKDIMTPDPVTCSSTATLCDAAAEMAQQDIGDVVVVDESSGTVCGVVTDRDIVVRGLAKGLDPSTATLTDVCTTDLITLGPDDTAADAVSLMRTHSVRRIPVMQGGQAVGMISLGDLAVDRDPESALADISRAPATV
jgi:CBS domain-containing protein